MYTFKLLFLGHHDRIRYSRLWICDRSVIWEALQPFSNSSQDNLRGNAKNAKMKGGMVGMTLNKGAIHRWIMGQSERSAITRQSEAIAT